MFFGSASGSFIAPWPAVFPGGDWMLPSFIGIAKNTVNRPSTDDSGSFVRLCRVVVTYSLDDHVYAHTLSAFDWWFWRTRPIRARRCRQCSTWHVTQPARNARMAEVNNNPELNETVSEQKGVCRKSNKFSLDAKHALRKRQSFKSSRSDRDIYVNNKTPFKVPSGWES